MIKINLLAEAKPTKKKRGVSALGGAGRLNVFLLAGAIALGIAVIGVEYWLRNAQQKEVDEKVRVAQAEVTRLDAILKEVKDYEDKKARLQKKVDLINQLKQNQRGPVRLMDEVSRALPDLLWVERMDYKSNAIELVGKALNPNAVANFLENLKRVPAFQEPKVGDISACSAAGGNALYCFRLSFVFASLDKMQPEATPPPAADAPKAEAPSPQHGSTPGGSTAAGM
ncbi:MAG: PilN domain-containing protein [Thermoanaerobaculia bacterium]